MELAACSSFFCGKIFLVKEKNSGPCAIAHLVYKL